jgi:hypothetical protein
VHDAELSEAAYFRLKGYPRQKPEFEEWMQEWGRKTRTELAPHQALIDERSRRERERYEELFSRNHDTIGRVLKCHLILEHYIVRHLESISPEHDWGHPRLGFAAKVNLLPKDGFRIEWMTPALREINNLRNSLGHKLTAEVRFEDLKRCQEVVNRAQGAIQTFSDPIELIEEFTTAATIWLLVDKEIERLTFEAGERARALMPPVSAFEQG